MVDVVIRALNLPELAIAADILRESFATVAAEFGLTPQNAPTNAAFSRTEDLEADYANGCRCYGLFVDGVPAGFMELKQKDAVCFELKKLGVHSSFRHAGYGRRLLDHAKEEVVTLGGTTLQLGLIEENTILKNWYAANGFVHTGATKKNDLPFTSGYMEFRT